MKKVRFLQKKGILIIRKNQKSQKKEIKKNRRRKKRRDILVACVDVSKGSRNNI
jgi:hypothetical protein